MKSSEIHSLIDELHRQAQATGFCGIGFADAISGQDPVFRDWLTRSHHAGMHYLERHAPLREQPDLLLTGVKTILIAALPYSAGSVGAAGYAAYAQGTDYHEVLRQKLTRLADLIRHRLPETRTRIAVDSAPISERGAALRAGIGWRGRQGQVIRADSGARLLLGEILMTAHLPPSAPVDNLCGTCDLCLTACPTGALHADGTVDARRCLSYWTIEHHGPIPEEIRDKMGSSLFGCDRCIAVCPWNSKSTAPAPPEWGSAPLPSPAACLELDQAGFLTIFQHSAVRRTGLKGLQRNALIVLGNRGAPESFSDISRFADSTLDPDLRELADWARHKIRPAG
jgi:epoxyqueuosine reductase